MEISQAITFGPPILLFVIMTITAHVTRMSLANLKCPRCKQVFGIEVAKKAERAFKLKMQDRLRLKGEGRRRICPCWLIECPQCHFIVGFNFQEKRLADDFETRICIVRDQPSYS